MGSLDKARTFLVTFIRNKMLKACLTVFIGVLVLHLDKVDGKQCFDCKIISGDNPSDDCGDFDQRTPQCRVADSGDCMTTTITGSGQKFEVHSCDALAVCEDQKNRCIDQDGATQCCCDGELCNSSTFLYGSFLVLLPALLAQRLM